jgi:ubiquinone/menaquinone biosynthesis C-methylase UbiE
MAQPSPEEQKARIRALYNATADHFEHPPLNFWNYCGVQTVELAEIRPGDKVLDVCCGTGASAIPAADRVGKKGSVTGVDFAEKLLEIARTKAEARALSNLEFVQGDMTALRFADDSFDAVVCVFGIFFAPDMPSALSGMWSKVKPGGTLTLTVWGPRVLEPGGTTFWETVEAAPGA